MNLLNIKVPKDSISMIFDAFGDVENYNTTLFLHKSKIGYAEEGNKYSAKLEIDMNSKKDKLVKQIFNKEYGSYIITFLNADFSNAENAYYSFFIYYGLEGFDSVSKIYEKYPIEYTARYISTKNFLDYYNKAFEYMKKQYIEFQDAIRKTVDFVFNLRDVKTREGIDKYFKFIAFSNSIDLANKFHQRIKFSILSDSDSSNKSIKEIEELANDIANNKENIGVPYIYESSSHFALAYIALNDLVQNCKNNISVCQNCGRYYLQKSGKEVYCDLPNLDGSPSCRSYASRKTYEEKITEDIAELTYKREYQRRITRVYRSDKNEKTMRQKEFVLWKTKAREQLSKYRQNKITQKEFCDWIEKNK